ncbi:class I SAM-dependent methyltransferase [Planosporangium mesophilum]|uniref:Methyltransferase n=1 Tax=Planosporangium mesophilum TaxID=689768 RepID=A0A8J3X1W2_9ACTN|nr:class I SAM-dependent methyltransferase [Planosporangium mesophilum]NJC82766.1 class I SAM-dependent methyltransferase [Planosporangium mesophilum]GII23764.1 methyltransferase [Planosporangium mesophilum]
MTTTSHDPEAPQYSFDNNDPEAADRHNYLAEILDEFTFSQLSRLAPLTGRRCLELGAGAGTVASWLAGQVGPAGHVLATDLDPRYLPSDAGYSVLRHDLRNDPVPGGPWDLIHARLVLVHLPERREILKRLVAALAPGGHLAVADWATTHRRLVLATPDPEATALVDAYHDALVTQVFPGRGADPTWAESIHAAMLDEGLVDVTTEISAGSWPGGSAGARLIEVNLAQLRADFEAAGFTPDRLDRLRAVVNDPRVVLRGHFTYLTVGRRPVS